MVRASHKSDAQRLGRDGGENFQNISGDMFITTVYTITSLIEVWCWGRMAQKEIRYYHLL